MEGPKKKRGEKKKGGKRKSEGNNERSTGKKGKKETKR